MSDNITVKFIDFWPTFDHHNNIFVSSLKSKFSVDIIPPNDFTTIPDILFYSRCGHKHYLYNSCIKIYYTGENDVPNFNECDYAISFHNIDFGKRHIRYPLYLLYEYEDALKPLIIDDSTACNRDFCSVVIRNHVNCNPKRLAIVDAIESYKPIAYGGPWRNNVGGPVEEKIPFIAKYKFNLALENSVVNGYVTEKILEAFAAKTVPLYYGSSSASQDFNPESFININDFNTPDSFIAHVRYIDNTAEEYLKILKAPALLSDTKRDFDSELSEFLCEIASTKRKHTTPYGEMGMLHRYNKLILPMKDNRLKSKLIELLGKL